MIGLEAALGLFKVVTEQVSELVKSRKTDSQQLFSDIVEPLFAQLQPVADNYFELFRHARTLFDQGRSKTSLAKAASEIRRDREKMLQVRRQVTEMAEQIEQEIKEDRVVDFAFAVQRFFTSIAPPDEPPAPTKAPPASAAATLVNLTDPLSNVRATKKDVIEYIDSTLAKLEDDWVAIASSYARVRLRFKTPGRYKV
jgi:hypothetical protein